MRWPWNRPARRDDIEAPERAKNEQEKAHVHRRTIEAARRLAMLETRLAVAEEGITHDLR